MCLYAHPCIVVVYYVVLSFVLCTPQSFLQRENDVNIFAGLHHLLVQKDVKMTACAGREQREFSHERKSPGQ